jgi:hypothetical protein
VQYPSSQGRLPGIIFKFRHQIMPDLSFNLERSLYIDFTHVGTQVGKLFLINQSEFRLDLRQRHPQAPPQQAFIHLAPNTPHFWAAVAPGEWRQITRKIDVHIQIRKRYNNYNDVDPPKGDAGFIPFF